MKIFKEKIRENSWWIILIIIVVGIYSYINWYIPYRNLQNGFVIIDSFSCPKDHPIKANLKSMIYHIPYSTYYNRTNASNGECFDTIYNAMDQGFRAPYN
jgi:hypothetical protein